MRSNRRCGSGDFERSGPTPTIRLSERNKERWLSWRLLSCHYSKVVPQASAVNLYNEAPNPIRLRERRGTANVCLSALFTKIGSVRRTSPPSLCELMWQAEAAGDIKAEKREKMSLTISPVHHIYFINKSTAQGTLSPRRSP